MIRRQTILATAATAVLAVAVVRALPLETPADLDGDGQTDYAVVRNVGGGASGQVRWFSLGSVFSAFDWGIASDSFTPSDFDGDGKTDRVVWRSGAAGTAAFYILQSLNGAARVEAFGQTGDNPQVVADYDGDGRADPAVYRAGANPGDQSVWYYRGSFSNPGGNVTVIPWGSNGDFPAPGDYDGDGKSDVAVQRAAGGQGVFYIRRSSDGGVVVIPWGLATDLVAPGDYDGDGLTDLAVVRSSGGTRTWWIRLSSNGTVSVNAFGASATDMVTPGDYDGDGITDIAIWRQTNGAFWVRRSSTTAVSVYNFGTSGDYPIANGTVF